jgi:predicted transcriptional regulator/rubredoxin
MQASDIMTSQIISIRPEATIGDAAQQLAETRISGMPVVDEQGQMVGMVTEADLISKTGASVADIMTAKVISVREDTPVDQIAQLLTGNRIKRVAVVRDDRLVGIVSRADIVRMMASRWVCQVCGHILVGSAPRECPSCGAEATRFERDLNQRPEISSRQ